METARPDCRSTPARRWRFGLHVVFPRIVVDPEVCGARPIVAGTRIRVTDVLELLAGGGAEAEILADYPYLAREDIRVVLAYAASAAAGRGMA